MEPRRIAIIAVLLVAFYYLWSVVGFLTGMINYGGPANQTFAAIMSVVSTAAVLGREKIFEALGRG